MKTMIYSFAMAAALALFSGCSDDLDPVLTQKDWDGTTTYFAPTDEMTFSTYYKPYVGYVGDPMPFYDPVAQDFKVMYLQEYRPNQADTYHPIWAVQTTDAASYTSMGELIPTGTAAEADAAIGTGSTVYNESDGLYYTFYTGHTTGLEVVMYATSPDFKTWTKDRTFYLLGTDYGYSRSDFRDPFVYRGDDGAWHMLVSTTKDGKGSLAEFTSPDLRTWQHAGVFMTMMWDRFYECPDLFRMGDWWYLVYSEKHSAIRRVQYLKGRTLDELRATTAGDAGLWPDGHEGFLDSRGFYAGKTASNGTDRYIWGWCPTREGNDNTAVGAAPNEPQWAGNLVAHRIIQHADGTLTLGPVPELETKYATPANVRVMAQSESGITGSDGSYAMGENTYLLFNRLGVHNRIEMTVQTASPADRFGLSFARGTDSEKYYSIVVNPESNTQRKLNFEEEGPAGIGFVNGIDGYVFDTPSDGRYHIVVYTDNSVCTVYVNDNVAYTNRIYGTQKNCWSVNCYNGSIQVSGLRVSSY